MSLQPAQAQVPVIDDITSSSTSASAGVRLTVEIASLPMAAVAGSSVVLYLEDDYQVPDFIDPGTVYFTVTNRLDANVNGGGRVYVTDPIEISDDDHFGGDDDWDIRVFIPDMNDAEDSGYNGPAMGDTISLVFTKAAGIKNPSEAHDSNNNYASGFKAAYAVLGPNDRVPDAPADTTVDDLIIKAKIGLSDEDNKRGYELVVTGSGFNNGTTAGVYVLNRAPMGDNDLAMCEDIVRNGSLVGGAEVGSDDRVAVTIEVTVPTFMAGTENYICMVDGEGRASFDDIEQFELESSIRVVPTTVAVGDTVTILAQDYPVVGASFTELKLAGQTAWLRGTGADAVGVQAASIGTDHSATATFTMPSGVNGVSLIGTIRIDAAWGNIRNSSKTTVTDTPSSQPASTQLAAPANLTVAPGMQSGTVNLRWDAPANAQYHFVAWIPAGTTDLNRASILPFSAAGMATISGLNPGATYHFIVIAGRWEWSPNYGAKWSEWSGWVSAAVP